MRLRSTLVRRYWPATVPGKWLYTFLPILVQGATSVHTTASSQVPIGVLLERAQQMARHRLQNLLDCGGPSVAQAARARDRMWCDHNARFPSDHRKKRGNIFWRISTHLAQSGSKLPRFASKGCEQKHNNLLTTIPYTYGHNSNKCQRI